MTSTFSLNDHFAIILFDFGADFSFILTTFLPLIHVKPNVINLSYEMEIANGLWIETNKSICGYRFDLEGHTFINDLVPFRLGRFDVIMRIDWLSKRRAKIVCFEKIVQISLSNGKILEAHGEQPEEDMEPFSTNYTETTKKIDQVEEILKAARDRQKSYAESQRNPLEFSFGDRVLLKVSPRKGVVRFRVHDTFHMSNLKKCLADANLHVPLEEVKIDNKLHFVKEPIEIMDQVTWEREDEKKRKYPQPFARYDLGRATEISGRNSLLQEKIVTSVNFEKVDENVEPVVNDSEELRKCIETVPDDGDEVLIEATPISSSSPTITDYKIHKEARAITQRYYTATNNRLCTSSYIRNQAVIQDGRIDIQSKNVGYGGNGHYAYDFPRPKVHDAKYFKEQILLAIKDDDGGNLNEEENDSCSTILMEMIHWKS
nr:hypothetical protein [Tanacetum cinerariifolium]